METIDQAILDGITAAFRNLSELNEQLYDFWVSELYKDDETLNLDSWNQAILAEMEKDVQMQLNTTK